MTWVPKVGTLSRLQLHALKIIERKKERIYLPRRQPMKAKAKSRQNIKMFEAFCITIRWDYKLLTKTNVGRLRKMSASWKRKDTR